MDYPGNVFYLAGGGLTVIIFLLLIFFYYRILIKKLILQENWFGKNTAIKLFNIGLTIVLFKTVLNAFIIGPFMFVFNIINSYSGYINFFLQNHSAVASKISGPPGSDGNYSLFQALFRNLTDLFGLFTDHFSANAMNVVFALIFLIVLVSIEQALFWNDSSQTYSVDHLSFTMKKTLGLLIVILIGFYLLFVALVATSKISTSTYDPHITLTHLDSLLKNDLNPDDLKKNLITTDTALNAAQLRLQLLQLDSVVKFYSGKGVSFPNYAYYKSGILSSTESAKHNYQGLITIQNQQVNKLLSSVNLLQTKINNAYTENSGKLTNPQREKYVGQLSDYYSNIMLSGNSELSRSADFIQRTHLAITDYIKNLSSVLTESVAQIQTNTSNKYIFAEVPYSTNTYDFGYGNDYSSINASIPPPDKPSADWGFVGSMSSWLTDSTSLNLAIIIGMLGFGIFGAGISTFITKEVESPNQTNSILESMTRVLVKGFSAALVIYLVAKSGLALANNSNSDPNPYFLYFSCLAGAVFSDRIWDWARSIIDKNYNVPDPQLSDKANSDDLKGEVNAGKNTNPITMATKTITFIATFSGGAGSVTFTGIDGLSGDKTLTCDPANPTSPQSFKADQSCGPQSVILGGTAPNSGNITVDVKDDQNKLLTTGVYKGLFVGEELDYTIDC